MRAAPLLPLVQVPPIQYATELAEYIVNEKYESFLTELASQNMQQQMRLAAQQQQFREQQQELAQSASRLSLFQTTIAQALSLRSQTPATVTCLGKALERRNVSKERRIGAGSGHISLRLAAPRTNPLTAAFRGVEPRTPMIVVENERPYAVARSTPLPATPHNPAAIAPATVPAAPAKPAGNAGWGGFPGPAAQSATAYCSADCRIEGEGSELTWTHQVPCLQSESGPIVHSPSPEPRPSKLKKICCPYCDASTHIALDNSWDFNKKFPPRQNTTNQPPISSTISISCSD